MNESISDYRLEKLKLGELSEEESRRLLGNPEIAERLALLEADDKRILEKHPFRPELYASARNEESAAPRRRAVFDFAAGKSRNRFPALSIAAAVLAAVIALPFMFRQPAGPDEDYRVKGGISHLYLYKKTSGEAAELTNGAVVRSGDAIQIAYASAAELYGIILSVDGNGQVTQHLPERGDLAVALQSGRLQLLDYSYVLDSAPDFEIFLLITSNELFDGRQIRAAAAALKKEPDVARALEARFGGRYKIISVKLIKE